MAESAQEPGPFRVDETEIRKTLADNIGSLTAEIATLRSALRLVGEERRALQEQVKDLRQEIETLHSEAASES